MYDIIGRVKENVLPDAGTSEQDLPSKFCNFFVDMITNIGVRLRDNSRFVVQREREPGMLELNQVLRVLCAKDNRGKCKATICRRDPIPSKLIKKFKVYLHSSHHHPDKPIT